MRILKFLEYFLLSLLFLLAVQQYFFCPVYSFTTRKKFEGKKWYNPYSNLKHRNWGKYNFHAHTYAWNGITNGKGSPEEVERRYDSLNYKFAAVSNYHQIHPNSILPVYEHGFNFKKTHQQVLGVEDIQWLDYFFPQTLSNKQHILNSLHPYNEGLTVLNHPRLRNGYDTADMQQLDHFELMEVLHPSVNSSLIWDAALSNGKPIFLVANDDFHNVFNTAELARYCTFLASDTINQEVILEQLKWGKSFGMEILSKLNESALDKRLRVSKNLPSLLHATVSKNSFAGRFDSFADSAKIIGDEGKVLKVIYQSDSFQYQMKKSDSYVRVEAFFKENANIYLNPIYRYTNHPLENRIPINSINTFSTILLKIFGTVLLSGWVLLTYILLFGHQKRSFLPIYWNNRSPKQKPLWSK